MDEYIDRDALLATEAGIENWDKPYGYSIEQIKRFPAADVEPVRHGHWVKSDIPNEEFRCSECGGACWYYDCGGSVTKSKYCPNCGAKMDLEHET